MGEGLQESEIELEGRRLAVVRAGPAGAEPILCLHGWLDNVHSFLPLFRSLPDLAFVAIDMPGHGRSAHRPDGAAYHQLDWVIDAVEAADALGLDRFSVMGHSMGAGIGALLAGTVPERVRSLVMLEGAGPRATPPEHTPRKLRGHIDDRRALRDVPPSRRGGAMETAVRARLAFSEPLSPQAARLLCERGVRDAPRGVTFSHDRRLQRPQPTQLTEEQICAFLAAIECPTLLLLAEEGSDHGAESLARRRAAIRQLQEVRLRGGHHVHMDEPEAVAAEVGPFLRRYG